jgi:hypothetical protein
MGAGVDRQTIRHSIRDGYQIAVEKWISFTKEATEFGASLNAANTMCMKGYAIGHHRRRS